MPKPPIIARLNWKRSLAFDAASGSNTMVIDGDSREGPSPMETLAFSLVGCMSADIVYILNKGRNAFSALSAEMIAERAPENPHRLTGISIQFIVRGDVPTEALARAIDLSHEKYCSVWHSLRQDVPFKTSFQVIP